MKFTLHDMTPQKGVDAIEDMLDSYIEADDKKYLVFLKKLKKPLLYIINKFLHSPPPLLIHFQITLKHYL